MKIYGNINSLVSNGKKIVKSRNRRQLFEQMFPEIPLPPEPVRTRWGLWLKSVEYYTKYFTSFGDFVKKLDANESKAIEDTQNLIKKFESSLTCDLTYIKANFNCLIEIITKLETNGMLLFNSLNLIDSTLSQMRESHGIAAEKVLNKFNNVLTKNSGFNKIKAISDVINGSKNSVLNLELTPEEIASFKFAPITSCDVERSFPRYKNIL
jgi:hypothetical protein